MKQLCILIHFGNGYTAVVIAWFSVVTVLHLSTFLGIFR